MTSTVPNNVSLQAYLKEKEASTELGKVQLALQAAKISLAPQLESQVKRRLCRGASSGECPEDGAKRVRLLTIQGGVSALEEAAPAAAGPVADVSGTKVPSSSEPKEDHQLQSVSRQATAGSVGVGGQSDEEGRDRAVPASPGTWSFDVDDELSSSEEALSKTDHIRGSPMSKARVKSLPRSRNLRHDVNALALTRSSDRDLALHPANFKPDEDFPTALAKLQKYRERLLQ